MRERCLLRAALLTTLLGLLPATPGPIAAAGAAERAPSEARVIVRLKAASPMLREQPMSARQPAGTVQAMAQRRADRLAERAGVRLHAAAAISERAQVVIAAGVDAQALARRLAADPDVEFAAVDQRRHALRVPNDPLFAAGPASGRGPASGQWYLRAPSAEIPSAANAEAAWDRVTGRSDVVVAVVDTGVLADHLDLAGRVLPGYDMISDAAIANDGNGRDSDASDPGDWITAGDSAGRFNECGVADSSWHGTQVAGVIAAAADNGLGMAGTAFGVKILPVRVLGKCGGFDSDIQAGMRWAAGLDVPGVPHNPNKAQIINLSLGSAARCDAATGYPQVIAEIRAAGTAIVAAAGNSAGHAVSLPADCPGVIAVAGLRHAGSKVGFSDLGPQIAISAPAGNCVNITAGQPCLYPILSSSNSGLQQPNAGGSIWTDSFDISVGTSFASPIVAGTAALMLSAQPALTPDELLALLRAGARPFPSSGAGDDGNGQPVPMCRAPDGTDQLQCYCSEGLCGAGMLDAAAAVSAALGTLARIDVEPAMPQVGDTLRFSAASSLVGAGHSIVAYEWWLDSTPVAAGFSGAADAAEVQIAAAAAGTLTLWLVLTDELGQRSVTQRSVTVGAAAEPPVPVALAPATGGGGGGASSAIWVALLALAVAALLVTRRRA